MKKVLVLLLTLTLLLAATGCGADKVPTTPEVFKEKAEGLGFTVTDVTSQMEEGTVEWVNVAAKDGYQVEFMSVPTEEQAKSAFDQNKADFEKMKGSSSSNASKVYGNYGYFSMTSEGSYMLVIRVAKTFIFAKVPEANKDDVKALVDAMGY